ncbi:thioredoxin domain-containing protein [Candidatus Poribacteria bacterium]|nr:thioredoxin domain-containing protein [Candidatus Poribacteria bacterium]
MEDNKRSNRLIFEKSPYLLQHAYNPVDWYPWGEAAFEKAKKEDKPIFLSIGYSTCHWCHVMEKESFEDPKVAKLMNETFVSIKVDKEERPDLDNIYMTVCQMMTGSGGWPLTIIITPDKKPFFAATYIPKETRYGRIGMKELIPRVREVWKSRREEVLSSSEKIADLLKQSSITSLGEELSENILDSAYAQLSGRFDERYGGFGDAPKFPTPHNLTFLLRYWKRTGNKQPPTPFGKGDEKVLHMVEETLQAMRLGGIYDHIGFGFHRYSTDAKWFVPHFEKMLYDQAMLTIAYVEGYQATGHQDYKQTAQEILTYILRDMTAPDGGFYSAEDADSEGEEGKFYVWSEEEIRRILPKGEAELAIKAFNVEEEGNFKEEATGEITGKNILYLRTPLIELASELKILPEELRERLESARQKLFDDREKRIRPHRDEKVLTDWNGLMIAAMAKAAQAFDQAEYINASKKAADFILAKMMDSRGRLYHRYREGEVAIQGFLDDYAFLIWGLIEIYETDFEVKYLKVALELTEEMIKHFWDEKGGAFYFTADDAESVILRRKEIYDGATPSGNSVAMLNLLRLGRIMANPEFEEKARQIGRAFSKDISQSPSVYTQMMAALDFEIGNPYEIVLVGNSKSDDMKAMLKALRERFIPNKVIILRPTEVESPEIIRLANYTKDMLSIDGKTTAYVCQNYSCKQPTTDIGKMLELFR